MFIFRINHIDRLNQLFHSHVEVNRVRTGSDSWSHSWVQLLRWAAGRSQCRTSHQQRDTGQPIHTQTQSPCGPSAVGVEHITLFTFYHHKFTKWVFYIPVGVAAADINASWLLAICWVKKAGCKAHQEVCVCAKNWSLISNLKSVNSQLETRKSSTHATQAYLGSYVLS